MRVACIGGAHVDVKARVRGRAIPGTSNPAVMTRTPGGVACNVARTLARLGVEVRLVSVVGDDASGASVRSLLGAEGVDATGVQVLAGSTTASYLAVLDGSGALVIGVADMGVYDRMDGEWASDAVAAVGDCDVWVVDANVPPAGLSVIVAASGARTLVADPVSVEKATRLDGVLGQLDLVFPDRAEAAVLAGGDADPRTLADRIVARGAGGVVVSLGADGAWVRAGGADRPVPVIPPDRVEDVTGAGDAGIAGWVYALGSGAADPARWSAAVSSLTVETGESVRADLTPDMLAARVARGYRIP